MSDERREQLKALLLSLKDLPPLPLALATIMNLMADEDVNIKEVEKAILQEPAVTAKVLGLANSSFYGYRRKVSTISQAIVVLGLTTVRNLVMGVYMVDGFRVPAHAKDAINGEAFWLHCVCTATVAEMIAGRCRALDKESTWIAGLLHDLGKMVLNYGLNDKYVELVERGRAEEKPLRLMEEAELGANHALVGEWMSNRWQLPPTICSAVRFHHEPQAAPEDQELVAAIHLADILVKQEQLGDSGDLIVPKIVPAALTVLNLTITDVRDLLAETREQSEAMREFHRLLV